jgi:threonylcarbamoyladenosine tRNA methylthiotransferase MtaB
MPFPVAVMADPDIISLGCRLNIAESETIRSLLKGRDMVVVNSCAVTGNAVRDTRHAIRRARRERPGAEIVVTGCAAQIDPKGFAAMPEVDRVIGNAEKLMPEAWAASDPIIVGDIMQVRRTAPQLAAAFASHARAFVEVQNGCDHRCTFCTIPFGRGNSRSVPAGTVIDCISALVDAGHREVVLTGVDLTSYGADLPGTPKLGQLTKQILRHVPELKRLRISSIDSIEADRDLLDVIADDERLMPHLHLSLQSGDDLILKRMKRRHSRRDAIEFCTEVRRLRPDIALGADIITGFPTETEEMFARSQDLVDECDLTFLHVFPYSKRPGTPAARMPQVAGEAIKERAKRLRVTGEAALRKRLASEIGMTRQVLIESGRQGRTEHFLPVAIAGETPGAVQALMIAGHDSARLTV